jgi:radical SAM protein with 4Fe4S-binding SPASM domain
MIPFSVLLGEESSLSNIFTISKHTPLIVWNITRECNLKCKHCYIDAKGNSNKRELKTQEAKALIDEFREMGFRWILFSGGEPLLREDIFALGEYASEGGIKVAVSTNGTLITKDVVSKIKGSGFKYVGVSVDGRKDTHEHLRGVSGSFDSAISGLRNLVVKGIKSGLRFTLSRYNIGELDSMIELCIKEGIPRFCMYHLVYSGRGRNLMHSDITNKERREIFHFLKQKVLSMQKDKLKLEILTADNHVDGVYLLQYIERTNPERKDEVLRSLKLRGGCSAGERIVCVDWVGNVYPCQFWHKSVGNVRESEFIKIWSGGDLQKIRDKLVNLKGKCGRCFYKEICGGCRVRAEAVYGDLWEEDPSCYM